MCVSRCHSVTSDESGKVKFHVPLSASLPKDVTKLSIKVNKSNLKETKIPLPQAKAMNRKADNVTGMKQPVSKSAIHFSPKRKILAVIFISGVEARRVPIS